MTWNEKKQDINRILLVFLLVMPYLEPGIISAYPLLDQVFSVWRVISFLLAVSLFLKRRTYAISKRFICLAAIAVGFLFSTMLDPKADLVTWGITVVLMLQIPLVVEMFGRDGLAQVSGIIYRILAVEIVINAVSQVVFPNGLYAFRQDGTSSYYFLGMDNRFVFYYMQAIAFGCTLVYLRALERYKFDLLLLIMNFSLFYAWSVGAMIGIVLFDIFYLLGYLKRSVVGFKTVTLGWVVLYVLVTLLQRQNMFSSLIQDVLHKSLTLSGRVFLWESAQAAIMERPLMGYGIVSRALRSLSYVFLGFAHPHNQVLYILYQGGAVSLLLHVVFIVLCLRRTGGYRTERVYSWILGVYAAVAVMSIADAWADTGAFYTVLYVVGSMRTVVQLKEEKTEPDSKDRIDLWKKH